MIPVSHLYQDPSRSFALIQRQGSEELLILTGHSAQYRCLAEVPRCSRPQTEGLSCQDSLSVVPFHLVREKGYAARDAGEPIHTLLIEEEHRQAASSFLAEVPALPIDLVQDFAFTGTDQEYEALIKAIVEQEIGMGEGANFVIPRQGSARIASFGPQAALSLFRRLVEDDYGTYWKFLFWNPTICFIGSTPERHLEVRGGRVRMNPISGTFRKEIDYECREHFKQQLLSFLRDPKEINELFMVVDEELKMMARMCRQGGAIVGPLLKEMSRLIHTEYLLSGLSDGDVVELFRHSMFAATVVGSPVGNACRIIEKYQAASRRYYGSALMLLGRDEEGRETLDAPITIRTLEIDPQGRVDFSVGATLVRDSIPAEEVAETKAKAAAVLSCLQQGRPKTAPARLPALANDDDIAEELVRRNQQLSRFWMYQQSPGQPLQHPGLSQGPLTLVHNDDDFLYMLEHMLRALGCKTRMVAWQDCEPTAIEGPTILGPGPGNPLDGDAPKIRRNLELCARLLERRLPTLGICLGHQILCRSLGCGIRRLDNPMQGVQRRITLLGRHHRVGFYNTFVADQVPVHLDVRPVMMEEGLAALIGSHFIGFQFHPESLLTTEGLDILAWALDWLGLAGSGSQLEPTAMNL
jgi:2-amino-4-deoxychorismate synthase